MMIIFSVWAIMGVVTSLFIFTAMVCEADKVKL